jgi:hypothetical protein
MSLLGETTLTRRRYAASTWSAGRATGGAATDSTFLGSVQPLPGKDRQVLPEGVRQRDGRKVYCARGTLRVEDQHAGTAGDEVLIDGVTFTVVHVDADQPLLEHDRAFVVRPPEAE